MIRKAAEDDIPALSAFFDAHIESSMFLLGNLLAHGIGNVDHTHGTTYFLRENGDGIAAVLGATNGGMLMCQMPGLTKTEAEAWAYALQGYTLHGMTGDAEQAALFLEALPLGAVDWQINADQPLFMRDIETLDVDDVDIRPVAEQDRSLLRNWLAHYVLDTGMASEPLDGAALERRVDAIIAGGVHVFLLENGAPTAMAGLNAVAGRAVQVGGVFVPRDLRGQGRAGRVVAAHLRRQKDNGAALGVLFAASDAAAGAYTKIGFERAGAYRVALLAQSVQLGTPQ